MRASVDPPEKVPAMADFSYTDLLPTGPDGPSTGCRPTTGSACSGPLGGISGRSSPRFSPSSRQPPSTTSHTCSGPLMCASSGQSWTTLRPAGTTSSSPAICSECLHRGRSIVSAAQMLRARSRILGFPQTHLDRLLHRCVVLTLAAIPSGCATTSTSRDPEAWHTPPLASRPARPRCPVAGSQEVVHIVHTRGVSLWGQCVEFGSASSSFRVFGPEAGFEDAHRARE
jgi:hypothetical protein